MRIQLQQSFFDLSKPLSIAIPLHPGEQVNCYYAPPFQAEPVVMDTFIGDVTKGSPVNYYNVHLNPHGNGTHTECLRHIADLPFTITDVLQRRHFLAQVISVSSSVMPDGDSVVMPESVTPFLLPGTEALIIRTLPNATDKKVKHYSGTNPPYISATLCQQLREAHIEHILVDLPSLDREEDGGALAAHKAFWHYPESPRTQCTITELIYVPEAIADGRYLLELAVAPISMDAAPSWPVLYAEIS